MPLPAPLRVRLISALIFTLGGSILGLALWLQPDTRGFGTHQQLGFAPCGMLLTTGLPCPTCGMTTAFSCTMHGHWLKALWAQPAGFALALLTAASVVIAGWSVFTGRPPRWPGRPISPFLLFSSLLALLLFGWAWKLFMGLATHELPVTRIPL